MKLRKLEIELHWYGENAGKYTGTIEFEGQSGSQKLILDPIISAALLDFCGPAMTSAAKAAADNLQAAMQLSISEAKKVQALSA